MPENNEGAEPQKGPGGKPGAGGQFNPFKITEDPEALQKVLGSVAEMIESFARTLERVLDEVVESLEGEKVGSDVAAFYAKIREAGIPEEEAKEMTREYFRKRISVAEELVKAIKETL